ncbi:MAG: ComEC/Rec2 family competence protein [Oscillospiraceae bacterium]|nr:ComEC/Rec2 family competence protein [Oscillospiraceae bacterium]
MKIKRPLFITALSILVVIYAANTMPKSTVMFSLALFALFIFIHKFTRNKYTAALILSFVSMLFGLGYLSAYSHSMFAKTSLLESMDVVEIKGEIKNQGTSGASQYYDIKVDTVNGEKFPSFCVRVYNGDMLERGDIVTMSGKFKSFTAKSNYIYNYSQGIFGYFYTEKIKIETDSISINKFFNNISIKLKDRAYRIFNYKYSSVAIAMGLGDKDVLNDSTVSAFNFSGISHALVVSGLHVGFVVLAFNKILQYIPVKKKIKNIVLSIFVFLFMGMIGFTPSVIRAGCLVLAFTLGRTFIQEIDNFTVLAIIILITIIVNPYSANNGSLLLSYSAYFGVIQAARIINEKELNKVIASLLVTTFACLYTAPVLALLGMDTTILSPLFNLIVSPVIMVVCTLSFFLPLLYYVPVVGNIVCGLLAPLNNVCIAFLLKFTSFVKDNLDFAMVSLSGERTVFMLFVIVLVILIAFIRFDEKRKRSLFIIIVPIIVLMCYNYMVKDIVSVRVFDGSSEPSYIVSYRDKNYLIMTENINNKRFTAVMNTQNIDSYEEIFYCPESKFDTEFISQFSDKIIVIDSTGTYENDIVSISAEIEKRSMIYVMNVGNVDFVFNHKKADLSKIQGDFYFFGSDTPEEVSVENCYYFYPVIKANKQMAEDKEAVELYDILTIKINLKTGNYSIVKDVKNFGSQL